MDGHHLHYPLPYPLPRFFPTTLPEPYPKSKSPTRHSLLATHNKAHSGAKSTSKKKLNNKFNNSWVCYYVSRELNASVCGAQNASYPIYCRPQARLVSDVDPSPLFTLDPLSVPSCRLPKNFTSLSTHMLLVLGLIGRHLLLSLFQILSSYHHLLQFFSCSHRPGPPP